MVHEYQGFNLTVLKLYYTKRLVLTSHLICWCFFFQGKTNQGITRLEALQQRLPDMDEESIRGNNLLLGYMHREVYLSSPHMERPLKQAYSSYTHYMKLCKGDSVCTSHALSCLALLDELRRDVGCAIDRRKKILSLDLSNLPSVCLKSSTVQSQQLLNIFNHSSSLLTQE